MMVLRFFGYTGDDRQRAIISLSCPATHHDRSRLRSASLAWKQYTVRREQEHVGFCPGAGAFIWLSSRINAMCLVHNHSHRLAGLTCCQNSFYGSLKERRIWYTPR
ncbi:uncharacterized protein VDAG_04503 [Verticillium dahliae VdLs.17]|uniref:Uncharacterized protein n=1 Tax=Verticillium dahliae (strain VdLs.17 / ATCC MYA-4575 / FGSC 10137) TaxID=498257 RepID=G2X2H9_VERDV|nr:uncharacterized protein VDAG_04503 [Verticillium dahliae VdLs.17]EGY23065.1 hypothetical protein VDAG_04503 [Verticillium dahliae VdLs.17]KAH6700147.1 hypothetical protein EV126DRAFT_422008 [Verticillium dahliae]